MNNSQDSIYVAADFTSSKDVYYPDNTVDHFRLKLTKPLMLTGGRWVVALCEIEFNDVQVEATGRQRTPKHYQVDFSACEGLLVHGKPSNALRWVHFKSNSRKTYGLPYYVPVCTNYIESCELRVQVLPAGTFKIVEKPTTYIACVLHFKKVRDSRGFP